MAVYTTIDDPSAHFQATTYTGTGASQTVINGGNSNLQPDWLWIKNRTGAYAHALFDSNRGLGSSSPPMLESDSTAAENSNQNWISSVGSDGFTIGVNEHNLSNSSSTYVAYQWKAAGGTTASNGDGDISSTVQVNSTAGFSIVTYTGNFTATQTVGHGLGVRPDMVIIKNRDTAVDWVVWSKDLTSGNFVKLNSTDAQSSSSRIYQDGFTTSTFGIGANNSVNKSGDDLVAYCFASKQGYSKFGTYEGNGNSDGPFIYTGFKPAFVIAKNVDGTTNWRMNGPDGVFLSADTTAAVYDSGNGPIDRLSNGFKIRGGDDLRANHNTFIYMAWAANPFVTSTGVPTTAGLTGTG